jgi:hypothetical protein
MVALVSGLHCMAWRCLDDTVTRSILIIPLISFQQFNVVEGKSTGNMQ